MQAAILSFIGLSALILFGPVGYAQDILIDAGRGPVEVHMPRTGD